MRKKILIFGGSGFIGSSLTKQLLEKKHQVCVVCSNKEKAIDKFSSDLMGLEIKVIDIFNEDIGSRLKPPSVMSMSTVPKRQTLIKVISGSFV